MSELNVTKNYRKELQIETLKRLTTVMIVFLPSIVFTVNQNFCIRLPIKINCINKYTQDDSEYQLSDTHISVSSHKIIRSLTYIICSIQSTAHLKKLLLS